MDTDNLSRMKLDLVTPRGVQLATLFMQGVEMALLANDASGAPVPFLMCCPWLFFDGKLFHSKLRRAVVAQNLIEMCNHDMQMVVKVGRRQTIEIFLRSRKGWLVNKEMRFLAYYVVKTQRRLEARF